MFRPYKNLSAKVLRRNRRMQTTDFDGYGIDLVRRYRGIGAFGDQSVVKNLGHSCYLRWRLRPNTA